MNELVILTNQDRYDTPVLLARRLPGAKHEVFRFRFGFALVVIGLVIAGGALVPLVMPGGGGFFRTPAAEGESNAPLLGESLAALPADPDPSQTNALPAVGAPRSGTGRVVIEKLGVSMPIVEGENEQALLSGAWRYPFGSTPDQGGNTVLFGHRYKNLPPNPETFFALDKLAVGDQFTVLWGGKTFRYRVVETKVVPPTDISVLDSTTGPPTLTLITCTPVFTTKARLVIRSELI